MGYTESQAKAFIEHIGPMIQKEGFARGYRIVSTTIAQAVIEGACGTSRLARDYHNHFGMKCGSSWKGKYANFKTNEEYTKGTLTVISAAFRAYDNDEEGVKGYYDFINTKRYANLKNAISPVQFAQYLKNDGWATSSTYVNTLNSTVNKYSLWRYDKVPDGQTTNSYRPTIKRGAIGEIVELLQGLLAINGYNIKVDGQFGPDTEAKVKDYQTKHDLTPDGIVGPQTWRMLTK